MQITSYFKIGKKTNQNVDFYVKKNMDRLHNALGAKINNYQCEKKFQIYNILMQKIHMPSNMASIWQTKKTSLV